MNDRQMKKYQKTPMRLAVTIFLLLFQIILYAALAVFLLIRFPFISYIGYAISFLVFLFILKKNEASAYKVTWIIIVLIFPPVGGAIYLFFGKEHRARRKIISHVKEHALIARLLDNDGNLPFINEIPCSRTRSLFQYVRHTSSYHAYKNTSSKYYPFGELMFEDMLKELEKAEKFIFLEYFIIKKSLMWTRLIEILERKAAEGVEVKIIVDDWGSALLFTRAYIRRLRQKNINVLGFNPMLPFLFAFMNNRDHRKIMVVDGHTAFVGGLNIADEYINKNKRLGTWKDTGIRLKGDGVWSFTLMFIEMWDTFCKTNDRINDHAVYRQLNVTADQNPSDGLILPYGDSPLDHDRLGENVYVEILNQAKHYVYIFTPYLIISEKMIHALQMAAKRGVDVRITMPGIPDKRMVYRLSRSYYRSLLEAGVKIYEYTPGFLHAKSFISDDEIAIVGTINLDYRSLYLHFECAVLLYNSETIHAIKDDTINTINESTEVLLEKRNRGLTAGGELLDAFLHLFAPLL